MLLREVNETVRAQERTGALRTRCVCLRDVTGGDPIGSYKLHTAHSVATYLPTVQTLMCDPVCSAKRRSQCIMCGLRLPHLGPRLMRSCGSKRA